MRILVTGGAGFIGSHVVDRYIAEGHQVIVVDDLSSGKVEYVHPKAEFYKGDIRSHGMERIFNNERPEIVNHHAAHISVRGSVQDPISNAEINILGTLNLLECCRKYGVRKFIFASSGGAIYKENLFPSVEDSPICPISPYGLSKVAMETYLHYYCEIYGLNCVSLRYSNVYGPKQNPYGEAGVVAIFIGKLLSGKPLTINGNGLQTRDYVYVEDVAKANCLVLADSVSGFFNIGTGIETNVKEILNKLVEITQVFPEVIYGPEIPGEQKKSVLSYSKALGRFGWYPVICLHDGLRKTVEYFRKEREINSGEK